MIEFLSTNTELLWAAIVSAVVSAGVSYFFRRREARHKLEIEYEQRRKLRDLIGLYHGRLLNAANNLNYRFWNLYSNYDERWLDVHGGYKQGGYYFASFVYRFLAVCVLSRQFENEAVYLDARIAEKKDFTFLNYVWALGWVLTDAKLFEGLQYDQNTQRDHFFGDNLRQYCDACLSRKGEFFTPESFRKYIATKRSIDPVMAFFDSLHPSEDRFRWDRLVAFHLILLAFINSFGYHTHYTPASKFVTVARNNRNTVVLDNLVAWLPRLGLTKDKNTELILVACKAVKEERS